MLKKYRLTRRERELLEQDYRETMRILNEQDATWIAGELCGQRRELEAGLAEGNTDCADDIAEIDAALARTSR